MENYNECRQDFLKAKQLFNNQEYNEAKNYFYNTLENPHFQEQATYYLTKIYIQESKYDITRQLLEQYYQKDSNNLNMAYGLLETIESNFESAKQYYQLCMNTYFNQNKILLELARLNIQTGDNEIGRKMFETLKYEENYQAIALINLILVNILEQKYDDGYELLEQLSKCNLRGNLIETFENLKHYLKYFTNKTYNKPDINSNYLIHRLYDDRDDTLLSHISSHINQQNKNTEGCFFKYIDLKKIVDIAHGTIENMNPNHFELLDMYRFRLDNPIGFKEEKVTSDLCVMTIFNTKKIVTMYPVYLSNQFDRENIIYSKELTKKRGGMNGN